MMPPAQKTSRIKICQRCSNDEPCEFHDVPIEPPVPKTIADLIKKTNTIERAERGFVHQDMRCDAKIGAYFTVQDLLRERIKELGEKERDRQGATLNCQDCKKSKGFCWMHWTTLCEIRGARDFAVKLLGEKGK